MFSGMDYLHGINFSSLSPQELDDYMMVFMQDMATKMEEGETTVTSDDMKVVTGIVYEVARRLELQGLDEEANEFVQGIFKIFGLSTDFNNPE